MNKKILYLIIATLPMQTFAETKMFAEATSASETTAFSDTTRIYHRVFDLDEVVVVSQPKETSRLRLQPTSSSVFSSKEMERLNIESMSDLAHYVPSLAIPAYGSRLTSSLYVRGIGSRTGDPAMGVYYDNIPLMSKSAYNSHIYQLDRADILRGPQGTLYGVNTEGGLMRLYSKNPMSYQATEIRVGSSINAGDASNTSGRVPAATNIEVAKYHRPSEELAFSIATFYSGNRGIYNNTNLGEAADKGDEAGARAHIVWRPSKKLSMELTTDWQHVNENAFPYGEYNEESDTWSAPSTTVMNGYKRNMLTVGLHTAYRVDSMILSSTTSYQLLDDHMTMDQDYLPADFLRLTQKQLMNAVTQEFTLKTRSISRWQHTSGVFFSHEWLRTEAPVYFGDDMNTMIMRMIGAQMQQVGMPAQMVNMLQISDNAVPGMFHTPRLNLGIYHESNISITDRLTLTLGLRYDYLHNKIDYDTESHFSMGMAATGGMPGGMGNSGSMPGMGGAASMMRRYSSVLQSSISNSYHELLPKFAVSYRIDDRGNNVYATVSKGFRAGGYNLQMFSDIFQSELRNQGRNLMALMQGDMSVEHDAADYDNIANTITYSPEESWNFEAGAHLNLLDGALQADLAGYYMRVDDQQLSVMADKYGYGRMMINAGRTASYGAEAALRGTLLNRRLSWAATYSYTHSTFREGEEKLEEDNTSGDNTSLRGNRVPFIPAHAFSLMADYRLPIAGSSLKAVTFGADVSGKGDIYWDTDNEHSQPFHAILGAHVAFDLGKVGVNLWGKNLTDTGYNTFLVSSAADGTRRSFSQRGMPLRLGVDISLKL